METLSAIVTSRILIFCSLGFNFGILVSRQAIYILVSLHLRILEIYIFVVLESLFLDNKKEPLLVALS